MATIATTITTDRNGRVISESRQVLTPVQVRNRRGVLQSKTIRAYNEGRGRRNRSPYANRAMGSQQGVLPANEQVLTREVFQAYEPPNAPAPLPASTIRYQYDPEGDKGRAYEQARKAARKAQGR